MRASVLWKIGPDVQVVLVLLEGLFDLGKLDVEDPQGGRPLRGEVSAQQVASFSAPYLAQPLATQAELQARRARCVFGPCHLDQGCRTDGVGFGRAQLHKQMVAPRALAL